MLHYEEHFFFLFSFLKYLTYSHYKVKINIIKIIKMKLYGPIRVEPKFIQA
jgi:hypothetical protein